jgi:hypothetical protein
MSLYGFPKDGSTSIALLQQAMALGQVAQERMGPAQERVGLGGGMGGQRTLVQPHRFLTRGLVANQ